jgi:hypothetical protein
VQRAVDIAHTDPDIIVNQSNVLWATILFVEPVAESLKNVAFAFRAL